MAVQFSDEIIDTLIAPEASLFCSADIPDMSTFAPQCSHWVANYFQNSAFRGKWPAPLNAYAYNYLRRAEAAFCEYTNARAATLNFLERRNSPSLYALTLLHWEIFLGQSWHAYQLLVHAVNPGMKVFGRNTGSVEERLNKLYNQMKHVESRIEKGQMPAGATVPVWLTNEGLKSIDAHLSYRESAEVLKDLAKWADALDDPRSAANKISSLSG
jgi:hypothetical protein